MADLFLDLLPGASQSAERGTAVLGKVMPDRLYIPETDSPGAIKRALTDSGWVDGDVIAAGDLRQGKEPTVVSMLTGRAVIEALRPRRVKALPRHFVLAMTRDRVVAFNTLSTGDDDGLYELWVRPGEVASWSRESVRLTDLAKGAASTAGTLELAGVERAPVYRPSNDPSSEELFGLLAA
jgi:hypothetical protein